MRNKHSYTIVDMYKAYHKINENVSCNQFKTVLRQFNQIIKKTILDRSEGFKMPAGLGYIRIVKYKPKSYSDKSLSVDYKTSKQLDKKIYFLNEHSDGYKFRLYWSRIPMIFANRYKYQLSLVRQNKRYLAQLIFKHNDYINANDIQIYKM